MKEGRMQRSKKFVTLQTKKVKRRGIRFMDPHLFNYTKKNSVSTRLTDPLKRTIFSDW